MRPHAEGAHTIGDASTFLDRSPVFLQNLAAGYLSIMLGMAQSSQVIEAPAAPAEHADDRALRDDNGRKRLERASSAITMAVILVLIFSATVRLYELQRPNVLVFDETYYARDAHTVLHGYLGPNPLYSWEPGKEISWPHPEYGKFAIAVGEAAFGNVSFGWRIVSAICGTLLLVLVYPLGRRFGLSPPWALLGLILAASDFLGIVQSRIATLDIGSLPLVDGDARIGPCVAGVSKFICIGLNYSDHAAETGATVPPEPIIFMKATSAIMGPNDDLEIPRGSEKTDWEVELGVVIGKKAKYVSEAEAMSHVAGYCLINDVSERAFQIERQGQWTKGKSADTFGPIGPWLVTRDEVADPQQLAMWLEVNGVRRQHGSTATMVYGVAHLVAYLSQFMSLQPGDIISTGTPPGVGMGMKPPVYLKAGDEVTLGIEGLGTQKQSVVQA